MKHRWVNRRKNKVHEETALVRDIISMSKLCGNTVTIARIVGCNKSYVRLVLLQYKSTAHVYLSKATLENIR